MKKQKTSTTRQTARTHPYRIGKAYFVQTVTLYFTGRLKAVYADELEFSDGAWIADTGLLTQALANGVFNEVELVGHLIVPRGAIVAAHEFDPALPLEQK